MPTTAVIPTNTNQPSDVNKPSPHTWLDHFGKTWKVPSSKRCLKFSIDYPGQRALRAFIFYRDRYTCQWCSTRAVRKGTAKNGHHWAETINDRLQIDHIYPWSKGGSHHPDNLQALCGRCNLKKSSLLPVVDNNAKETS